MRATLEQCAQWSEARPVGDPQLPIEAVHADSRLCRDGSLFVGIAGPRFDGNEFVESAFANGAVAALVQDEKHLGGRPGLVADDTIAALGKLAHGYRMSLDIPWIGLTGSNGKTTTREILACILRQRGPVVSSLRNYNNNIGVPLSILSAPDGAWAGVIEIGTNAPGEIYPLACMLAPKMGIITTVGRAHLEGLGSPEAVAREKASLFDALPEDGFAVLPLDTPHHGILAERAPANRRVFSVEQGADIFAENIEVSPEGLRFDAWETHFESPLLGRHNVGNILAAVAAADWLGVTPAEAAEAVRDFDAVAGRLQPRRFGEVEVIDDSYNANPDSLRAAVDLLCSLPAKRRVAIVASMGELGAFSEQFHRESGFMMAKAGIDLLIAAGPATVALAEAGATGSARIRVHYFPSVAAILPRLAELIQAGDLVLVKGSRAAHLEKVVGRLERVFGRRGRKASSERRNA